MQTNIQPGSLSKNVITVADTPSKGAYFILSGLAEANTETWALTGNTTILNSTGAFVISGSGFSQANLVSVTLTSANGQSNTLSDVTVYSDTEIRANTYNEKLDTGVNSVLILNDKGVTLQSSLEVLRGAAAEAAYNWVGGGYPGYVNSLYKMTQSTETWQVLTGLPYNSAITFSGTGSTEHGYGYVWGGRQPAVNTRIQRVSYATDVSDAGYTMSIGRGYAGAGGTKDFGHVVAGYYPAIVSYMDRLTYASSTVSIPGNFTAAAYYTTTAQSNPSSIWCFGDTVNSTRASRFDFSTDTSIVSNPATTISGYLVNSVSDNKNYIWYGGYPASTMSKYNLTNETSAAAPTWIGSTQNRSATVNYNDYGYISGGTPAVSYVYKITFSSDTYVLNTGRIPFVYYGGSTFGGSPQ